MRRRELRRGSLLPASRTPVAEDEPGGWYEAYGVTEGGPVGRLPKDPETGITPEERMEPGAATETAPIVTAVVCELTVPSDQGGEGSSWAPPDPDASVPDQTVDALRAILRTAGGQVEDVSGPPGAVTAVFGPEDPDGEGPIRAVRVAAEVRERIEGPVEDGPVTPATRSASASAPPRSSERARMPRSCGGSG